jgi:diaminohydroxyphosphoribosylaminopyrimidine deaminase/5-amino-6-(5-phosphoribosylamino)uracil reductase
MAVEARQLNEVYFHHREHARPFVVLKWAQSLDGRIATSNGDSRWISSEASRTLVHRWRAGVDAVVVGAGTLRSDDPSLTVRLIKGRNPYRIIIAGREALPARSRLLAENGDGRTIVAASGKVVDALVRKQRKAPVTFWTVKQRRNGQLDLSDFLAKAGEFGLRSLLVEGGGKLATALIKEGLVDKFMVFVAPKLIGEGTSAVGPLGTLGMSDAIAFGRGEFSTVGSDMLFVGYPERKQS